MSSFLSFSFSYRPVLLEAGETLPRGWAENPTPTYKALKWGDLLHSKSLLLAIVGKKGNLLWGTCVPQVFTFALVIILVVIFTGGQWMMTATHCFLYINLVVHRCCKIMSSNFTWSLISTPSNGFLSHIVMSMTTPNILKSLWIFGYCIKSSQTISHSSFLKKHRQKTLERSSLFKKQKSVGEMVNKVQCNL